MAVSSAARPRRPEQLTWQAIPSASATSATTRSARTQAAYTANEKNKKENLVGGVVGALVGSLLGVASIILLSQMGYVAPCPASSWQSAR